MGVREHFSPKSKIEEGFIAQKACDGKPYLATTKRTGRKPRASRTSLGMTAKGKDKGERQERKTREKDKREAVRVGPLLGWRRMKPQKRRQAAALQSERRMGGRNCGVAGVAARLPDRVGVNARAGPTMANPRAQSLRPSGQAGVTVPQSV